MQSLLGVEFGEEALAGGVAGECSAYQMAEVVILFPAQLLPSTERAPKQDQPVLKEASTWLSCELA